MSGHKFGWRSAIVFIVVFLVAVAWAGGTLTPPAHALPAIPGGPVWWWEFGSSLPRSNAFEDCVRCPDGSLVAAGIHDTNYVGVGDILVAKFDPRGYPVWVKSWNGPNGLLDVAVAVTTDRDSNVIVAGTTSAVFGSKDLVVLKWKGDGDFLWSAIYDGASQTADAAYDVVTDVRGDVIACGSIDDEASAVVIKLRAATGARVWVTPIGNPPGSSALAHALVVDGARNLYVTGYRAGANGQPDAFLNKYSPAGQALWQRTYDGAAHQDDECFVLGLAPGPAVYAGGITNAGGAGYDTLLLKYDLSGHRKWVRTWNGAGNGTEWVYDMGSDSRGDPVLAGRTASGTSTGDHGLLIKYDAAGHRKWVRTWYDSWTPGYARFHSVVVSSSGRIWAAGAVDIGGGNVGTVVTRYTAAGTHEWAHVWKGPKGTAASPQALVSGGGGLLICGRFTVGAGSTDAFAGVVAK